jgi:hypothetical protein
MNEAVYLSIGLVFGAWIRGGMRVPRLPKRKAARPVDVHIGREILNNPGITRDHFSRTPIPEWDETDLRGGFVEGEIGR